MDSPSNVIVRNEGHETSSVGTGVTFETIQYTQQSAVVVLNAEKSYSRGALKRTTVLRKLNMNVPTGSIYCLLGASGSGKSTILSCIVGISNLDRGSIHVFGTKSGTKECRDIGIPGRLVGYMPQELSLNAELTIDETIRFTGLLHGLSRKRTQNSAVFLKNLFQIPRGSNEIGKLSGGEQRRVSLVNTLIHGPSLIILDEPTVGLDPILRQRVWDYLKHLICANRCTILITTHYLEEAKQANLIGVLREGKLIGETSPRKMMLVSETMSLRDAVLKFWKAEASQTIEPPNSPLSNAENSEKSICGKRNVQVRQFFQDRSVGFKDSCKKIAVLVQKNSSLLRRNYGLLFFVLMCPSLCTIISWIGCGGVPERLNLGVFSPELKTMKLNSTSSSIWHKTKCDVNFLSCRFLSALPVHAINIFWYETEKNAEAAVKGGLLLGYLSFPSNFSQSLYERALAGTNVTDMMIDTATIYVRLDLTNKILRVYVQTCLLEGLQTFIQELLMDSGIDPKLVDPSLHFEEPLYGEKQFRMQNSVAVSVAVTVPFFFSLVRPALRLLRDKKSGVTKRSMAEGLNGWEILVAGSLSELPLLILQTFIMYCLLTKILCIVQLGSPALSLSLLFLSGYAGTSFGLFLGTAFNDETSIAMAVVVLLFTEASLCGICWPLEAMDYSLQVISFGLPSTLPVESIRSIMFRGWTLTHASVWAGFLVLIIYVVLFSLLAFLCCRLI